MKYKVFSSFLWKFFERISVQLFQFIIQIILARILLPEDYGELAIVLVIVNLSNVIAQSGFNIGLLQLNKPTKEDYSSSLWVSLLQSIVIVLILFLISPFISNYMNLPFLNNGLRVLSFSIPLYSIQSILFAYVAKMFKFKILFFISLISTTIYGLASILFAIFNYGKWSLIYAQIISLLLSVIILWINIRFMPLFKISYRHIKNIYRFSSKILLSSLFVVTSDTLLNIYIGKTFDEKTLGFFNKGSKFPVIFSDSIVGSISGVFLPFLSSINENKNNVLSALRSFNKIASFIVFPIMIGLLIIAKPLILILLTEKWVGAILYLQVYCIVYLFEPMISGNMQVFAALGKSFFILLLEFSKFTLIVVFIIAFKFVNINILLIAIISVNLLRYILSTLLIRKLLHYKLIDQFKDIFSNLLSASLMATVLFFFKDLVNDYYLQILVFTIIGISVYMLFAFMLNKNIVLELRKIINK